MFDPRVVRVSTGTGFPNLGSDGSYTPSTRRDGLSERRACARRRFDPFCFLDNRRWARANKAVRRKRCLGLEMVSPFDKVARSYNNQEALYPRPERRGFTAGAR
mgnify:CR=1 FL=1